MQFNLPPIPVHFPPVAPMEPLNLRTPALIEPLNLRTPAPIEPLNFAPPAPIVPFNLDAPPVAPTALAGFDDLGPHPLLRDLAAPAAQVGIGAQLYTDPPTPIHRPQDLRVLPLRETLRTETGPVVGHSSPKGAERVKRFRHSLEHIQRRLEDLKERRKRRSENEDLKAAISKRTKQCGKAASLPWSFSERPAVSTCSFQKEVEQAIDFWSEKDTTTRKRKEEQHPPIVRVFPPLHFHGC